VRLRVRPTIQESGYLLISLYLIIVSVAGITSAHVVFAGFVFLILLLAGLVQLAIGSTRIEATRVISRAALSAGGLIEVEIEVRARWWMPFVEIYDHLSPRLKIRKGSNYVFTLLRPGRTLRLSYEVQSSVRGLEQIGPLIVRIRSPLSIFQRRVVLVPAADVRVYPRTVPVDEDLLPRRSKIKKSGPILSRHLGVGTEFYALRDYTTGDHYSAINWRVTARMAKPVVNEYEAEARQPVAIFLDARRPTRTGYVESNALEQGVTLATSLADAYLKAGHRVGLVLVGDGVQWVYPDNGRRQFYRILDKLIAVSADGHMPLRHWAFMSRRLLPKKGGKILLITPDVADPTLVDTVWRWVASGHELTLVMPSFLAVAAARGQQESEDTVDRIAQAALRMRQETIAVNVRRLGAQVVVWDPRRAGLALEAPMEATT
jgi:uncharacterized protein (DUF58 family)